VFWGALRLRIAFERFVASSTFPSSSALVNHQPYAPTRAGKIAPQAKAVNSGVRTGEKNQFSSPLRLRIDSSQASQQICCSNQFFLFSLGHARFLFLVKKIFLRDPKNKIHFFLVDFKTGF